MQHIEGGSEGSMRPANFAGTVAHFQPRPKAPEPAPFVPEPTRNVEAPEVPSDFWCERCHSNRPWTGNQEYRGCDGSGMVAMRGYEAHEAKGIPAPAGACPFWTQHAREAAANAKAGSRRDHADAWPIPRRCAKANLQSPPKDRRFGALYHTAREWIGTDAHKRGSLVLTGDKGSGKTWLACAVLNWYRERGNDVAFAGAAEIVERVQDTYGEGAGLTKRQILSHLERVPLLVIDDWGKHRGTEHNDALMFSLLDERYREELPLVITMNHGVDDARRDDDTVAAIRSRFKHGSTFIEFPRLDLRAASGSRGSGDDGGMFKNGV